jgi:SAM-dependent methyltransferase
VDCSSLAANVWWQAGIVGVAQGAAQRLPFPDAAFDLVTCLDVLYHRNVPDDLLVLQEIARVLRPRGALILRVPALAWICTARDERFHTRRRYGRRQLQERVSAAGFVIERLSYANALLLPLAIAQRWLGQCCPAWADAGDRVPPKVMNRLAEAVLHGEAWWLRRRNLGWGLSLVCRARRISEGANQRFEE